MFASDHKLSLVTAVLPSSSADEVVDSLVVEQQTPVLVSQARGTVLQDQHWWKSWIPPISPEKTMLRAVVPSHQVDQVVDSIILKGRLDKQAAGAVFSTPCEHAYVGTEFYAGDNANAAKKDKQEAPQLTQDLSAIFCSVGHQLSDKVAKAAINAGAHGPVVYYAEGFGMRDRLGWLRITKEHEQEVLMVIADDTDVEDIFDAMAKEGEFHLPGRGFMYRLPVEKGMFNLPSRVGNHHYAANTQQIINAIDHLTGHTHWRDQSIFEVGESGRGVGVEFLREHQNKVVDQVCFSIMASRDQTQVLCDLIIDAGAPGVNINYGSLETRSAKEYAHAHFHPEYSAMRCILDEDTAEDVARAIEAEAEMRGLRDLCVLVNRVPRVAKYVPTSAEHRETPKLFSFLR